MAKNTNFDIPVKVAGVRFRNPFYVSSGPTTMTVEQLERIDETGWGGASLKLTVDPEPYINRRPRYGYYADLGFLTFTAEKRLVLRELLELIEKGRKRAPNVVLFSNITYAGPGVEGWVNMAKKCEDAGVHINELNMCCPNMSFNVQVSGRATGGPKTGASLGQNEQAIVDIVKAIKAETQVPLFVKITPEGGRQSHIAKLALDAGADAVGGNGNRLAVPPINLAEPTRSEYYLQKEVGMACMNGAWLKPLALRDVYEMRKKVGTKPILTGTGGIMKWRDAVEMVMCGADLIGLCTATLVNGFGFMPDFIQGFRAYLKERGYKRPREMRDLLVPAIVSAPELTLYDGHSRKTENGLVAPCTWACPNSVPAQGYVRRIAEEEFEEAYQLIMSRSPLQSICGKICDHPCETECTRGLKDDPIRIRDLKRFVIEMAEKKGWKPKILSAKAPKKRQKVAVIGSGPAGLGCAYDLARAGYRVTVFEAAARLGGMLTSCIPTFRLNALDVEKEIEVLRKLGVKFKTKTPFGSKVTIKSLKKDGFAAIFLGIGAHVGERIGITGEDLDGSVTALDFLKGMADEERKKKLKGKSIAIIGGGFTAVDASRSCLRLGAKDVFILYRRTKDEMPATAEEVQEAEEEGVKVMYLVAPQEIEGNGKVQGIRMLNYVLGEKDTSSRRRPVEVPGTEFTLPVDMVISAVSQGVQVESGQDLERTRWQTISIDDETCATNIKSVYAGGDCARGPANVIGAIADGKRAAVSIDIELSGDKSFLVYDAEKSMADKDRALQRTGDRARAGRVEIPMLPATRRSRNFREYTKTLSRKEAVKEASRCLACGCGAGCETCVDICKVFAWSMDPQGRTMVDEDKCVACGMCLHRCPNDNINMVTTSDKPV